MVRIELVKIPRLGLTLVGGRGQGDGDKGKVECGCRMVTSATYHTFCLMCMYVHTPFYTSKYNI